jgi:hypothetical protein
MELAGRVAHERRMRALSIRKAAQIGGTSNQTWGVFEQTGIVTPSVRAAVSQVFEWPMDWPENPPEIVSLRNGDEVDALRADILDTRRQLAELLESRTAALNPEQEAIANLAVASIEQLRVQVTALVAEIHRLSAEQDAVRERLDALEGPTRANHA